MNTCLCYNFQKYGTCGHLDLRPVTSQGEQSEAPAGPLFCAKCGGNKVYHRDDGCISHGASGVDAKGKPTCPCTINDFIPASQAPAAEVSAPSPTLEQQVTALTKERDEAVADAVSLHIPLSMLNRLAIKASPEFAAKNVWSWQDAETTVWKKLEALTAENERLRGALKEIFAITVAIPAPQPEFLRSVVAGCRRIAREALK